VTDVSKPGNRCIVYLSGPISLGGTCSEDEIAAFSAVFTSEAARLRAAGHEVINPCECPPEDTWEAYMRHGLRAVAACDVVGVLPRWTESRGAALEAFIAMQLRIPVVPVAELA
jgi:hypothetical protein